MSNQRVVLQSEEGKFVTVRSLGSKDCLDVSLKDSSGTSLELATETKQDTIIDRLNSISNILNV